MGSHQPIRKTVTPEIPDKLYFRIGDVAQICEVPAYVLRFWETEFPQLKPNKGGTGQRLYRKRDVEMTLRIKSLLYDQGYTIPGARQVFKNEAKLREAIGPVLEPGPSVIAAAAAAPAPVIATMPAAAGDDRTAKIEARLHALRAEMQSLVEMLGGPASAPRAPAHAKAKPLRPRLVQAPPAKPSPAKSAAKPSPVKPQASRIQLAQRDLFGDGADATE
jgi:DNA-binding transcriptional MerR regulator